MSVSSLVKMCITAVGNNPMSTKTGDNMRKPNEMVFFNIGHTDPDSRCPIRLLTKVLAVEERAMTVMKVNDEMLRMMLVAGLKRMDVKCKMFHAQKEKEPGAE